jgi:hypothetical protein
MKNNILILITLILFTSCIEPIELKTIEYEKNLIVDALLTNELKHHIIKLSRTFRLEGSDTTPEIKATVRVIDNLENSYNFTETSFGTYISDIEFKAEEGKTYKLEITTSDQNTYTSREEAIVGFSEIDDVKAILENNTTGDKEGITINVTSKSLDENAKYFKYTFEETFKIVAPFWSDKKLEIVSPEDPYEVKVVSSDEQSEVCYKTEYSTSIIQNETSTLSNDDVNIKVHFIDKDNYIISHRYSILVSQHVQSIEAYTFYKTLKKISSSESLFTQNQPGLIPGNITSNNDINENVIGFFEVATVSKKRIFFNYEDFFTPSDPIYKTDCDLIAPELINPDPLKSTSPLIRAIYSKEYHFYKYNDNSVESLKGKYILAPKTCGDCSIIGSNIKPSFWID